MFQIELTQMRCFIGLLSNIMQDTIGLEYFSYITIHLYHLEDFLQVAEILRMYESYRNSCTFVVNPCGR